VRREDLAGEPPASASTAAGASLLDHPWLTDRDRSEAGLDGPLRKIPVSYDKPMTVTVSQIGMHLHKFVGFILKDCRQQVPRPLAQDLR